MQFSSCSILYSNTMFVVEMKHDLKLIHKRIERCTIHHNDFSSCMISFCSEFRIQAELEAEVMKGTGQDDGEQKRYVHWTIVILTSFN